MSDSGQGMGCQRGLQRTLVMVVKLLSRQGSGGKSALRRRGRVLQAELQPGTLGCIGGSACGGDLIIPLTAQNGRFGNQAFFFKLAQQGI